MGTIIFDPEALQPGLPPGGKPSWDGDYLAWARGYVRQAQICSLLQDDPSWVGFDLLGMLGRNPSYACSLSIEHPIINVHRLTAHLFKWLNGDSVYPHGINYQHRLRYVSIQFHYRPDDLKSESERYVDRLTSEAAH
jgi:hypothetical protein